MIRESTKIEHDKFIDPYTFHIYFFTQLRFESICFSDDVFISSFNITITISVVRHGNYVLYMHLLFAILICYDRQTKTQIKINYITPTK